MPNYNLQLASVINEIGHSVLPWELKENEIFRKTFHWYREHEDEFTVINTLLHIAVDNNYLKKKLHSDENEVPRYYKFSVSGKSRILLSENRFVKFLGKLIYRI